MDCSNEQMFSQSRSAAGRVCEESCQQMHWGHPSQRAPEQDCAGHTIYSGLYSIESRIKEYTSVDRSYQASQEESLPELLPMDTNQQEAMKAIVNGIFGSESRYISPLK